MLKELLSLYWARPETAIWRSLDIMKLKECDMSGSPAIDLGCGDGLFTFTLFDGKLDFSYDVYQTMKDTSNFWQGQDIHDQTSTVFPKVIHKPTKKFEYGLDHKQSLLNKASHLEMYENLKLHDLNKPLPFESDHFKLIFSNVIYWIERLDEIIKESYRILKKNGLMVVHVPNENFKNSIIYDLFLNGAGKWAELLDRGIGKEMIKHTLPSEVWQKKFTDAGFKIEKNIEYLSDDFIKFWSVGLRPYSPYLIEMYNELNPQKRAEIKKRLVQEISVIIDSYLSYENLKNSKKCFNLFVLTK